MAKIAKKLTMALAMVVFVISFSIPFLLFPSEVYADSVSYVIGDTGPAGGKVFYDKGNDIGNWRYLEAAPSDQNTGVSWSNITTEIGSTAQGQAIGTGQSNTSAIVGQSGCISGAAYICDNLSLNGYDDWFLPSDKELKLMYDNRSLAGIGGFAGGSYWSSSEYIEDVPYNVYALCRDMGTGGQGALSKATPAKVRAIRAFSVLSGAVSSKPLTPQEQVLLNLSICQQADLYGKNNTGFIKMLYDNILGRVPDDEGLNSWVKDLISGMTPADVVYYFVFSDELKPKITTMGTEEFVTFLYKNVFNREPDSEGYNNWVSLMKNGMSKEDALLLFLNGNEFKNICTMFGLTQ
jgi:hypothetical protein